MTILSCASPGRVWPEEDKGEVELLLMLISHICGMLLICAPACEVVLSKASMMLPPCAPQPQRRFACGIHCRCQA